jgi:hypothetical protein
LWRANIRWQLRFQPHQRLIYSSEGVAASRSKLLRTPENCAKPGSDSCCQPAEDFGVAMTSTLPALPLPFATSNPLNNHRLFDWCLSTGPEGTCCLSISSGVTTLSWWYCCHSKNQQILGKWGWVKTLVPLMNIKIAGKWMFIPLKMYL